MNQELFEKHLCNQSSYYEKYGQFPLRREAISTTAKSAPFTVSKDEWDTKEGTGKSTKKALYIRGMPKGTYPAEVMSNSEKPSP